MCVCVCVCVCNVSVFTLPVIRSHEARCLERFHNPSELHLLDICTGTAVPYTSLYDDITYCTSVDTLDLSVF